jgi:hypothetical protein
MCSFRFHAKNKPKPKQIFIFKWKWKMLHIYLDTYNEMNGYRRKIWKKRQRSVYIHAFAREYGYGLMSVCLIKRFINMKFLIVLYASTEAGFKKSGTVSWFKNHPAMGNRNSLTVRQNFSYEGQYLPTRQRSEPWVLQFQPIFLWFFM